MLAQGWTQALAKLAAIVALAHGDHSSAQEKPIDVPSMLTLRLATETVDPGRTVVVGGVPVLPADWPAVIVARLPTAVQGKLPQPHCTATLVGPRTVLTAAHCLDRGQDTAKQNRQPYRVQFERRGDTIKVACTLSPSYMREPYTQAAVRNASDYALCLLERDVPDMPMAETLDGNPMPGVGRVVMFAGYGCTEYPSPPYHSPPSETLMAGEAIVGYRPADKGQPMNFWLVLEGRPGADAGVCPGDSGGPTIQGAYLANQKADGRRIIGVTSGYVAEGRKSYTSPVAIDHFKSFLADWVKANGDPVVCGLNRQGGTWPCRR